MPNDIGKSIYISAALPATNDAAGFEALSWTEVKGLVEGPQFGYSHSGISIPDLKSGKETSVKGMGSGQDTSIMCRSIASDAGQALCKTQGEDDDGFISIKFGEGSGANSALQAGDAVEYAQGYLHSYLPNKATGTSYQGFTVNFKQNEPSVIDTEPSP